jgi:hypothetical protein
MTPKMVPVGHLAVLIMEEAMERLRIMEEAMERLRIMEEAMERLQIMEAMERLQRSRLPWRQLFLL